MRSLRRSGVVLHSLSNPRTFGRARPAKSHLLHTSARANWEAAAPVASTFILVVVILTAVAFDFTNGFHDTANAVATSIATGALKPIVAVIMSGCLNFVGAFISISVASTIAKGPLDLLSGSVRFRWLPAGLLMIVDWSPVCPSWICFSAPLVCRSRGG